MNQRNEFDLESRRSERWRDPERSRGDGSRSRQDLREDQRYETGGDGREESFRSDYRGWEGQGNRPYSGRGMSSETHWNQRGGEVGGSRPRSWEDQQEGSSRFNQRNQEYPQAGSQRGPQQSYYGTARGAGSEWTSDDWRSSRELYGGQNRMERGQFAGKGPKGYRRSDQRIEEDVNEALSRNPHLDATEIQVKVQNGEVTLTGTVTERHFKRMAEDIAEECSGVQDVRNDIRVQSAGLDSQNNPAQQQYKGMAGSGTSSSGLNRPGETKSF